MHRLDQAWQALQDAYAGLSEAELLQPGVTGTWSVKDIIAHVTWWEEEALEHLSERPVLPLLRHLGVEGIDATVRD